jgi:adenine/guanine/hypoxanthine permease
MNVENFFQLKAHGTTVRTEIVAGLTTFFTMAYIIFVNPAVLATDFAGQPTGMDPQAVMLATCVAAAIATAIMGLYAGYPIAQAPGMGNNHLFVSIVMSLTAAGVAHAWQTALGMVFISGVTFLLLSLLGVREAIIRALSPSMRAGISVGIGLFITFIGLRNGGWIVANPGTLVSLNHHVLEAGPMLFVFGFLVMTALHARRVTGSILIGILLSSLIALAFGLVETPRAIIGLPTIENPAVFQLDVRSALSLTFLPFIVMLVFTDLFDTIGTLVGVTERAGLIQNNTLPRAKRALMSDAIATILGSLLGTSTVTSYIESASGVEQGGRTGLVGVVVALCFLIALCFSPLIAVVASYPPITAPALVLVGLFMASNIQNVAWDDVTEALPAFLIVLGIPLTYSIADGLALGFLSYPLIKLLAGRVRDMHPLMWGMALVMGAYMVFRHFG